MINNLIEPSDLEQSEWPQATEAYVRGLEARIEDLESMLTKDVEFVLLPQMAAVTKKLKVMEAKLAKAMDVAIQAVNVIHETQVYEQPDDPWAENALTMCEHEVFDFDVDAARTTLKELKGS